MTSLLDNAANGGNPTGLGEIYLVIADVDGFTTNVIGLKDYFTPFSSLNLKLAVYTASSSSMDLFQMNDILHGINFPQDASQDIRIFLRCKLSSIISFDSYQYKFTALLDVAQVKQDIADSHSTLRSLTTHRNQHPLVAVRQSFRILGT